MVTEVSQRNPYFKFKIEKELESLYLLPTALQENTFVYELYNGNNERISSGNFSDNKQGAL